MNEVEWRDKDFSSVPSLYRFSDFLWKLQICSSVRNTLLIGEFPIVIPAFLSKMDVTSFLYWKLILLGTSLIGNCPRLTSALRKLYLVFHQTISTLPRTSISILPNSSSLVLSPWDRPWPRFSSKPNLRLNPLAGTRKTYTKLWLITSKRRVNYIINNSLWFYWWAPEMVIFYKKKTSK